MPPRRPPTSGRAAKIAAKIERLAEMSPTTGLLFVEWIDRLLAGESLEEIEAEMRRVLDVVTKHRRR